MTHDVWLDAERESGDALITLSAERIAEARGRVGGLYGHPEVLQSQRAFVVTALECSEDEHCGVKLVRGCFSVLEVSAGELRPNYYLQQSAVPWPTRVPCPARQNLSVRFLYPKGPLRLKVWWAR